MFTRKGTVVISHVFIIVMNTYLYHLNWEFRLTARAICAVYQLQYPQEIPGLWSLETLVCWFIEGMGFSGFAIADSRGTALHQPYSPQCKSGKTYTFSAVAWSLTKLMKHSPTLWHLIFRHTAQVSSSSVCFTYK